MPETERAQWVAMLDAAAQRPGDELNEEWRCLIGQLWPGRFDYEVGIGRKNNGAGEFFLAVKRAIDQGRWRNAKDPRAYAKTVAKREAKKMDLIEEPGTGDGAGNALVEYCDDVDYGEPEFDDGPQYEDLLSRVPKEFKRTIEPSPEIKDAVDRLDRLNATDDVENERIEADLALLDRAADELIGLGIIHEHQRENYHILAQPRTEIDLQGWAAAPAGFDEWDCAVLKYKLTSKSRDRAMSEQPDEQSRKALQAAWRRFDRNGVLRLREAINQPINNGSEGDR